MSEENAATCMFCFAVFREDSAKSTDLIEVQERFVRFVERQYLQGTRNGQEPEPPFHRKLPKVQSLFPLGSEVFASSCDECLGILRSFCELQQKIKALELESTSVLWKLTNGMRSANGRVPEEIEGFQLEFEGGQVSLMEVRRNLIEKCTSILRLKPPRISLVRCPPAQKKPGLQVSNKNEVLTPPPSSRVAAGAQGEVEVSSTFLRPEVDDKDVTQSEEDPLPQLQSHEDEEEDEVLIPFDKVNEANETVFVLPNPLEMEVPSSSQKFVVGGRRKVLADEDPDYRETSSSSSSDEVGADDDGDSDYEVEERRKKPVKKKKKTEPPSTLTSSTNAWQGLESVEIPGEEGLTLAKFLMASEEHRCQEEDCTEAFMTSKELDFHSKFHGQFNCQFCSVVEDYALSLCLHELDHCPPPPDEGGDTLPDIVCPRCATSQIFRSQSEYFSHHLKDHLGLVWGTLCPVCDKVFRPSQNNPHKEILRKHFIWFHNTATMKPYDILRCDFGSDCKAFFRLGSQLDRHLTEIHGLEYRRKCYECGSDFESLKIYHNHKNQKHFKDPKPFPFRCLQPGCYKWFEVEADVFRHTVNVHSNNHYHESSTSEVVEAGQVKCADCGKLVAEGDEFEYHLSLHNNLKTIFKKGRPLSKVKPKRPEGQYKCPVESCSESFHNEEDLADHANLHGSFPCAFCSEVATYAPDLAMHESRVHVPKNFKRTPPGQTKPGKYHCKRCPLSFQMEVNYVHHHLTCHLKVSPTSTTCPICEEEVKSLKNAAVALEKHFQTFHDVSDLTPEQVQRCELCSVSFRTEFQLSSHLKRAHLMAVSKKCVDCGKDFSFWGALRKHRLRVHRKDPRKFAFPCDANECRKRFETQLELHIHKKVCKRYLTKINCKICGKEVAAGLGLHQHLQTHKTRSSSFLCKRCGKVFGQRHYLKRHQAVVHSGIDNWMFECSVCQKKFPTRHKLKMHMSSHN